MGAVLIGNVGRLFSGYKLAATISHWEAVRNQKTLNDRITECKGRIISMDQYWVTQPITRMALRLGLAWWVWHEIEGMELSGSFVTVRAVGEPELVRELSTG